MHNISCPFQLLKCEDLLFFLLQYIIKQYLWLDRRLDGHFREQMINQIIEKKIERLIATLLGKDLGSGLPYASGERK